APTTTVAPTTTSAMTTTVELTTTVEPTTTVLVTTTIQPTTTVAPTITVAPTTTTSSTLSATTIVYQSYTCDTSADVYIDEESPATNLNDKTRLLVSYHPTKGRARGLWKFNIPGTIDAAQIDSATLHVSGSIHTGGGTALAIYCLAVYCYALNFPFDENTETWDTHSGGDYDASVFASGALPDGNDWETSIDVTTLVKGNLPKVRSNGMLMRKQQEGPTKEYQNIASRESTDAEDFAAHLEIVYASTGATTTVSSGGGGGGGGGGSYSSTTTTTVPVVSTTSTVPVTTSTTAAPVTSSTSSSTSTVAPSSSSTTSTSTTTALCPVIKMFQDENSREVTVIRTLRNRRMAQSIDGLVLIYLYYTNTEELTGIFSSDLELSNSAAKLIRELTPALELSLAHNTSMTVTPEQYADIITILRRTQDEAAPHLKKTIDQVLKKLASGEMMKVMGITIQEK
ncbi:MAG: DNRLRE domain-containing protein, partial [Proteobacteria bacterium]|nr:DNRLRE domain-containing protein [Pseudomonadota bacterium]